MLGVLQGLLDHLRGIACLEERDAEYQALLDEVSTLHTGLRPGALVEVRAVRQRQHAGGTVVADSVPVVVRTPRPLPLSDAPPGDARAMRTAALHHGSWSSVVATPTRSPPWCDAPSPIPSGARSPLIDATT